MVKIFLISEYMSIEVWVEKACCDALMTVYLFLLTVSSLLV